MTRSYSLHEYWHDSFKQKRCQKRLISESCSGHLSCISHVIHFNWYLLPYHCNQSDIGKFALKLFLLGYSLVRTIFADQTYLLSFTTFHFRCQKRSISESCLNGFWNGPNLTLKRDYYSAKLDASPCTVVANLYWWWATHMHASVWLPVLIVVWLSAPLFFAVYRFSSQCKTIPF